MCQGIYLQFSVSYQQGLDSIDEYIRWVSSCQTIVTCDSFGLHLASALRKNVVGIVGPTNCREFPYNRTRFISPKARECMPCNTERCETLEYCMIEVSPERVRDEVMGILNK